MSEYVPPTELEASQAALALANEYRENQRKEAEKYREAPPAETEEEFLERVRTVSETSPSGFSAPYVRPTDEVTDEVASPESVEAQIEDDRRPLDEVVSTTTGEVDLSDLVEPKRESGAVFGQQDDPSIEARAGIEENQDAVKEDETPRPDENLADAPVTEVESNDQTTIVDTGFTDPNQIETAQSVVNAKLDAEAEENGDPKPSAEATPVDNTEESSDEDTAEELSYKEKFAAIKDAKTADEVDSILAGDERKPLVAAAEKRKAELEA